MNPIFTLGDAPRAHEFLPEKGYWDTQNTVTVGANLIRKTLSLTQFLGIFTVTSESTRNPELSESATTREQSR